MIAASSKRTSGSKVDRTREIIRGRWREPRLVSSRPKVSPSLAVGDWFRQACNPYCLSKSYNVGLLIPSSLAVLEIFPSLRASA